MTTLEMLFDAAETKGTYVLNDLRYSFDKGFHDKDGNEQTWEECGLTYLNDILNLEGWKLLSSKRMTLAEIAAKLGYMVELIEE